MNVVAETAGTALLGGTNGRLARMSGDGSILSELFIAPGPIYTMTSGSDGDAYIAGQVDGGGSTTCDVFGAPVPLPPGDIYVIRLERHTLRPLYSSRLFGDCQSWPGAIKVTADGEPTLGLWTYSQFPLRNAVMTAPSGRCYHLDYAPVLRRE